MSSQTCNNGDDGAIQWFWLSKVREECPSYWCLVDPTTGHMVFPQSTTATTSTDTANTNANSPTTSALTASDVLARCISLVQTHWDTWTPERLTSTLAGKVVVVGVRAAAEVVCMGVLDIPVRFQSEEHTSSSALLPQPKPSTSSSSQVLQLASATFVIVAPAARGLGLGKMLMTKLEDACSMSHLTPSSSPIATTSVGEEGVVEL